MCEAHMVTIRPAYAIHARLMLVLVLVKLMHMMLMLKLLKLMHMMLMWLVHMLIGLMLMHMHMLLKL